MRAPRLGAGLRVSVSSLVVFAAAVAPSTIAAQECGNGAGSCCATPAAPAKGADELTVVRNVRHASCGTIARSVVFNELAAAYVGDLKAGIDAAEVTAARMREAPSDVAAAAILASARADAPTPDGEFEFAATLSATGFYTSLKDLTIADGFVPYEVNAPLWSDGAAKDRFVRMPAGAALGYRADGAFDVPVGTTFLQTLYFTDGDERLVTETRVIVQTTAGLAFGSYAWNDEQDDAELVPHGDEFYANHGDVSQVWTIAAEDECAKCHNAAAGFTLGFTAEQLNRPLGADGTNQLAQLAARGMLRDAPTAFDDVPRLCDPLAADASASLDDRVRTYLHVNCSTCHRPEGPGSGTLDLRLTTPLQDTGLIYAKNGGRAGVRAGSPRRSLVLRRMASLDWDRMPSLQSAAPDEQALHMIAGWVEQLDVGDLPRPTPKTEDVRVPLPGNPGIGAAAAPGVPAALQLDVGPANGDGASAGASCCSSAEPAHPAAAPAGGAGGCCSTPNATATPSASGCCSSTATTPAATAKPASTTATSSANGCCSSSATTPATAAKPASGCCAPRSTTAPVAATPPARR